jgi:signal transduction histidine kinase
MAAPTLLVRDAITLARHRAGTRVEVHVIDQGPGMTDAERKRAFNRFWRAPGTDRTALASA